MSPRAPEQEVLQLLLRRLQRAWAEKFESELAKGKVAQDGKSFKAPSADKDMSVQ